MARRLFRHRFGLVFAALLAVIVVGFVLLAAAHYALTDALYLTLMDLPGRRLPGRRTPRRRRSHR